MHLFCVFTYAYAPFARFFAKITATHTGGCYFFGIEGIWSRAPARGSVASASGGRWSEQKRVTKQGGMRPKGAERLCFGCAPPCHHGKTGSFSAKHKPQFWYKGLRFLCFCGIILSNVMTLYSLMKKSRDLLHNIKRRSNCEKVSCMSSIL